MTVKIQRQDGVVIEVEGSADDLVKVLPHLIPLQWASGGLTWNPGITFQVQCQHEYPPLWNGIGPPVCMKCGK